MPTSIATKPDTTGDITSAATMEVEGGALDTCAEDVRITFTRAVASALASYPIQNNRAEHALLHDAKMNRGSKKGQRTNYSHGPGKALMEIAVWVIKKTMEMTPEIKNQHCGCHHLSAVSEATGIPQACLFT